MNSPRREVSLGFSEQPVAEGQHICYLYDDDAERMRVMSKYFQCGLLANEKIMYLADVTTPEEMLGLLQELGIDETRTGSACTAATAGDAYCPEGVFTPTEMLHVCREFYSKAIREGFSGARSTGEMTWCLKEGRAQMEDLMAYEAQLSPLLDQFPLTVCCQYDTRRFDGKTIMDVLAVHPVVILRGQLVQNPFYVPPAEFLESRHAGQHVS